MPPSRLGAPRLIDWTGERCVPWAPDVQVVYEHYHRYLWAQTLVEGLRVLDLGSGEGFGAALLADVAREVVGIDVDARAVEHSGLNYEAENLSFQVASATDLGAFPDGAFDAVVAFEVIEHIEDQETVISEVGRVLDPGGLLIASTPERHAYSERTPANPFHKRELSRPEFEALLTRRFRSLTLFSQHTAAGSRITSLGPAASDRHLSVRIRREGDEWRQAEPPEPLYLVAVATNGGLPDLPGDSTLSDFELQLLRVAEGDARRAEADADSVRRELEAARGRASAERVTLIAEVVERTRDVDKERRRVRDLQQALWRVDASVTWQLFQRLRARLYGAIGEDSAVARALGGTLRFIGRVTLPRWERSEVAAKRLSLPRFADPDVSIVVPVYSAATLTEHCLHAILHASDGVAYEVVIVDDAADPDTKALLEAMDGVRTVVNQQNLGFLHSVKVGAARARGRHLVLLNNDTEPQPGWLRALVDRADSAPDVGVVAAKLVYPDGRLQEAGGIVWRDGAPSNYGNGQDPGAPEYNYVREVDYGSAAALLVRSSLWREVGGFDERYAPGYFEDTDLCFAARERGWRVLYEPRAVVVHVEGGTMGTDPTVGGKRYQALNQPKFAEKWRKALVHQPSDRGHEHARLASDRSPGPQVLVIDHRVPMPDRDSGSLRMWSLLEGLLALGCRVSFLPDHGVAAQPYTAELQSMGIEVLVAPVNLSQHLAALSPRLRVCVLSRPYVAARYMHLVREHAPGALVAYDTVDLHFLREERRLGSGLGDPRVAETFRGLEAALARASDVTLVVSKEERDHLQELVPDVTTHVVPNANEIARDVPGHEGRRGLLFIGSFEHPPNVDAAIRLVREVMPHVWAELEEMPLTIVGDSAPDEVTGLASPLVHVVGWVKDIGPLLRERLAMVAPLSYGAGMKGKVTQSLAAGLPVVTTVVGAEGLDVEDGRELLIADEPEALAKRIARLSADPDLWRSLSANGQALARRVCSPAVQRNAVRSLLEMGRDSSPSIRGAGRSRGADDRGERGRELERLAAESSTMPARLEKLRRTEEWEAAYAENEPLVTVRIATCNRAELLCERALPSVLRQTYPHWEVVVVGDACSDDTAERIAELGEPRIRFYNRSVRGEYPDDPRQRWLVGGIPPMNLAADLARGRWIAPLDDDDEWEDDHIEVLLAAVRSERAELAYGRLRALLREPPVEAEIGAWPPRLGDFGFQGAIYNAALRSFHYDMACRFLDEPGDWNLARRMWEAGVRFTFVERVVGTWHHERADRELEAWLRQRAAGG